MKVSVGEGGMVPSAAMVTVALLAGSNTGSVEGTAQPLSVYSAYLTVPPAVEPSPGVTVAVSYTCAGSVTVLLFGAFRLTSGGGVFFRNSSVSVFELPQVSTLPSA